MVKGHKKNFQFKSNVRKHNRRRQKKTQGIALSSLFLSKMGLMILFLILIGIGGFFGVSTFRSTPPKPVSKPIGISKTKPPKPRFEFYTILPKLNVPTREAPRAHQKQQQRYDVQVASTRAFADAEKMRARIILQGLDAHVVKVDGKNGTWYRVALGPYDSHTDAQAVLKELRKNDLDGIIRRVQ